MPAKNVDMSMDNTASNRIDVDSHEGKWLLFRRDAYLRELNHLEAKMEETRRKIVEIDKQIS